MFSKVPTEQLTDHQPILSLNYHLLPELFVNLVPSTKGLGRPQFFKFQKNKPAFFCNFSAISPNFQILGSLDANLPLCKYTPDHVPPARDWNALGDYEYHKWKILVNRQ